MILDIFAASGKRRIFYAVQTLIMLAILVLAIYGLKVMFNSTIEENFILFIVGTALCIITLIIITLPVVIASIMLFIASLKGTIKSDERGANAVSLIIIIIAIILTIIFYLFSACCILIFIKKVLKPLKNLI